MKQSVLRVNELRRRADAMGVDILRVVKWDAAAQREPTSRDDEEQREETTPAAPEVKGAYEFGRSEYPATRVHLHEGRGDEGHVHRL
jgi:hypothetical protein